jgi:hypothetical protein
MQDAAAEAKREKVQGLFSSALSLSSLALVYDP